MRAVGAMGDQAVEVVPPLLEDLGQQVKVTLVVQVIPV